ncbi:hypothetical protein [Mycobacteroides abscessus]|uniref:hypothetical protein n=1 Tax=Mycobacteroides abscessus TaxID=36809 RepID=UPI00078B6D28|nr:hypothetical protein [Mycobacteroides abscessus]AMU75793.1 hypothetical protein A3O06_15090 [Mycobacteroides abscessus]ANO24738.1 hypothetical protein BAB79_15085 [Mycobacteroides abscessus]
MTNDDWIRALLTPPGRRSVNEMKLQISEMSIGAHIGATFLSPTFGVYVVWGNLTRVSVGDLALSAFSIESKGKPANDILRFDTSGRSVRAEGPAGPAPDLEHGAIVRATFEDDFGQYNVVGPAVLATSAPMIGVGRWVLAYKGTPGVCLRHLDVLAAPGSLGLSAPPPTLSWDDTDTDASM